MVNSVFDGRSANLAAAQKKDYTILTLNHNIQRAACVTGITPFFLLGALGGQIIAGEAWRY